MTEATVIIAAWNAESTLERAVESALAQNDVDLEVIVADDASTDGTAGVAAGLARGDPRVRVLRLADNGGPSRARNAAIAAARGEWLAVLDADDRMRPGRLAAMIRLARDRRADLVFDDLQPVDDAGEPVGPPLVSAADGAGPARWDMRHFLAGNQGQGGGKSLGFLKPLLSRKFLQDTGIAYDESLRNGEDFHLVLTMLAQGAQLWFLPRAGYLHTARAGSISNRLQPHHAQALLRADAAFLDRHGAALDDDCRALLRSRQRGVADLAATETAMRALRAGRPDRAIAAVARRPRVAMRFLRQITRAMGKRIR